jgi:hypothetical protein
MGMGYILSSAGVYVHKYTPLLGRMSMNITGRQRRLIAARMAVNLCFPDGVGLTRPKNGEPGGNHSDRLTYCYNTVFMKLSTTDTPILYP